MKRRDLIRGAVVFSIGAPAVVATAVAGDPLLATIKAYQHGNVEFNRLASEAHDDKDWDHFTDITYGPPLALLNQWDSPALTREGAIEAMKIAVDDVFGVKGMEAEDRMMMAVLRYLENLPA